MRIVITQPDEEIPLATVEVDLTQYNFHNRPIHAGIPTYGASEWRFHLDEILRERKMMRLIPWRNLPNNNYRRRKAWVGGFATFVRIDP